MGNGWEGVNSCPTGVLPYDEVQGSGVDAVGIHALVGTVQLGRPESLTGAHKAAKNQQARLVLHIQEGRLLVGVGSRLAVSLRVADWRNSSFARHASARTKSWHGGRYGSRLACKSLQ